MADTQLDLQAELFEEFKEHHKHQRKARSQSDEDSIFNIALLKSTKVVVPFDTLLIIAIMFIFVTMTFYFLGIQRGKRLQGQTVVTIEKTPQEKAQAEVVSSTQSVKLPEVTPEKMPIPVTTAVVATPPKETIPATAEVANPIQAVEEQFKYTIQVGASRDGGAAEKDIMRLQEKGYDAFIAPYTSSNGKKWYKICVGRFVKTADAKDMVKKLKGKEGKRDCFLTNL